MAFSCIALRGQLASAFSPLGARQGFRSTSLRLTLSHADSRAPIPAPSHGGRVSAAVRQQEQEPKASGELSLQPPKGTRDFYPDDQRLKTWLFDIWKRTAAKYSFEEYDAPVVENAELYIRKAGEEVTQQLYDFNDKGGRHLSLRPEMTPSLARMCWRYERMTRGRRREHYQWNMDVFGVRGVEAEAELLSAIVSAFQAMGLTETDVGIKINSRKLLNDLMLKVGIEESKWVQTCILVDKLDKVQLESLEQEIATIGVDMTKMQQLVHYLEMNTIDEYIRELGADAPGVQDILELLSLIDSYGLKDWVSFDPTVVRGLAYYTGVVFEGFDRRKELRAICGGGRYDKLIESFGGEAIPAVGFGFGDAVIMELLKSKQLLPDVSVPQVDVVAYAMQSSLRGELLTLTQALRAKDIRVDVVLDSRKPKWVFQHADRRRVPLVLMVAEDEHVSGQATVKNLRTGMQTQVSYGGIVDHVIEQL